MQRSSGRSGTPSSNYPPGGVLYFHGLLHHGAPANRIGTRRRAVQLHYLPAGISDVPEERRLEIFGSEGKGATC